MALISVSNNALQNITVVPASVASGALVLLSTQTASSSASLSFTSGIDSTYDSYVFKFINIHPQNDARGFFVNFSTDGGSNYNVVKTTTCFLARHRETGATADLAYKTGEDLAQSTADQILNQEIGNGADECVSGSMQLFNPSSTTYVKHFISRTNGYEGNFDYTFDWHTAGYCNTTSAINAVIFRFNSSNIDDGIIKMYGVK
jgi:hypothetical protein